MAVYADVDEHGDCVNIIVAEEDFRPAFNGAFPGHQMIGPIDVLDPTPGIGWTFNDDSWQPPPQPEPRDQ